jgi:hypothetical protein
VIKSRRRSNQGCGNSNWLDRGLERSLKRGGDYLHWEYCGFEANSFLMKINRDNSIEGHGMAQ